MVRSLKSALATAAVGTETIFLVSPLLSDNISPARSVRLEVVSRRPSRYLRAGSARSSADARLEHGLGPKSNVASAGTGPPRRRPLTTPLFADPTNSA
jgi:hypothetical protein